MKIRYLALIFILVLSFRLFFVFQTPYYSSDDAYFNLRIAEHVRENIKPMIYDELSYGGREISVSQLFHYVLAIFSIIPFSYKILPAILISFLAIISYLIAIRITRDKTAALLSALMSGFIPIVYTTTINEISYHSLILPIIFFMLYCFMKLNEKKYFYIFIIFSFILPLIHPIAFLFSLALLVYIVLAGTEEHIRTSRLEREAILFSIFLILLIQFLIFKNAFIALGPKIIWQNTPVQLLKEYFKGLDLFEAVYRIGILPFILGITAIIIGFFYDRRASVILLTSFVIAIFVLLFLRLIDFLDGMVFLGVSLTIMSSFTLSKLFGYMKLTKFYRYKKYLTGSIAILIALTLIIPSYYSAREVIQNTISDKEMETLLTIKKDTDEGATILASLDEGHYITTIADRKNVIDSNFLYVPDIDKRFSDVNEIFTTISGSNALELLHKYNVNYIYFSTKTKEIYNIERLSYTNDQRCFRRVASVGENRVFKVRC